MKTNAAYLQGFNAQAVATEDQIIIAGEVSNDGGDVHQFRPMIRAATDTLSEAGIVDEIGVVVADAGYLHDNNLTAIDGGPEVLIATRNRRKMPVEQSAPRASHPEIGDTT